MRRPRTIGSAIAVAIFVAFIPHATAQTSPRGIEPFGACCFSDGSCIDDFESNCIANGGTPFPADCTFKVCVPIDIGACCLDPFTCIETDQSDCEFQLGVFLGNGSNCTPLICSNDFGACCLDPVTCFETNQADCDVQLGVYFGPGSDCTTVTCGDPIGACCDLSLFCFETTQLDCDAQGGFYQGDGTNCNDPCAIPIGACCYPDGTCDDVIDQVTCEFGGGVYGGDFTACDPVFCPPQGACCIGIDCEQRTESECNNMGGFYEGDGTDCAMVICDPTGACCIPGGGCTEVTALDCALFFGVYFGDFTFCTAVICDPDGACCLPDGTCIVTTESDCMSQMGDYQGDGTDCEARVCLPKGACCDPATGNCTDDQTQFECEMTHGVFQGTGTDCASVTCPTRGACCDPTGDCADNVTESDCTRSGGLYLGDGTMCDGPCDSRLGACCVNEIECRMVTELECLKLFGEYLGDGVECSDPEIACRECICDCDEDGDVDIDDLLCFLALWFESELATDIDGDGEIGVNDLLAFLSCWFFVGAGEDCPPPTGACCLPDGTCEQRTRADCEAVPDAGFNGENTRCNATACCEIRRIRYMPTGAGTTGDLSNDNPNGGGGTPNFMGGFRFFPGAANYANRANSRNVVRIRVVVRPNRAGIPIHFRSFDVDDPSAVGAIDPNGNGRDNRGTLNGALTMPGASHAPNGTGYRGRLRPIGGAWAAEGATLTVNTVLAGGEARAEVELATTFAPGDNFRVVASCNRPEVVALNETTSVPTTGPIAGGFTGVVTDQLSVWRQVHCEEDFMRPTPGDMQAGATTGAAVAVGGQPTQRDIPTNININRNNTYQTGILRAGGINFAIVSNTSGAGSTVRIELGGNAAPGAGAAITIFEDDYSAVGAAMPTVRTPTNRRVNTGLIQTSTVLTSNIYAAAYVEPEFGELNAFDSKAGVGTQLPATTHMPFASGPSLAIINPFRGTRGNETNVYWIAYLTSALQELESDDFDPNDITIGNGQITGFAPGDGGGTNGDAAIAYYEVIRDVVANDARTAGGVTAALLEQRVVAHELGHCFGLNHVGGNNVMNGVPRVLPMAAANARFVNAHINIIRQRVTSPGE